MIFNPTQLYETTGMPTGVSWRFHHWVTVGSAYVTDYGEAKAAITEFRLRAAQRFGS